MSNPEALTQQEITGFLRSMSNWGRWGDDDQKGALNLLTPEKVRSAVACVRSGETISLSRVIEFAPRANRYDEAAVPPIHFMGQSGDGAAEAGAAEAYDWAGLPLHGHYVTHLDAHSHLFFNQQTYNGIAASSVVTDRGALRGGVANAASGIVSRGVLLDVAAARGVRWFEGADQVTPADLDAAEERAGLRCEAGDVVLVRTGYGARRAAPDGSGARDGLPGLAPECIPWIRERDLAVVGTDTGTDPSPSPFNDSLRAPVHLVCIVAMGMWIIDNCDLEELAQACDLAGRWSFLFSASPLRLKNSTGSPMNPTAVL